jgi:glycosyltransferase involved in cell wall biosynthesis
MVRRLEHPRTIGQEKASPSAVASSPDSAWFSPWRSRNAVGASRGTFSSASLREIPNVDDGITPALREAPFVSLMLTTRDRPSFFPLALACYRHQTYANRELIVVDDGDRFPIDPDAVSAAGGRLIRTEPGTPLGTKLNLGAAAARGYLCLKMDDDDWYGPAWTEIIVARLLADWHVASRATKAGASPYLIFDVARWEIRRSAARHTAGGSLCFRKEDWAACPFRPVAISEDRFFLGDQIRLGTRFIPVATPEEFMGVRHDGVGNNHGHTWTPHRDYLATLARYARAPEDVLPSWALAFYQQLRHDLLAASSATSSRSLPPRGVRDSFT